METADSYILLVEIQKRLRKKNVKPRKTLRINLKKKKETPRLSNNLQHLIDHVARFRLAESGFILD